MFQPASLPVFITQNLRQTKCGLQAPSAIPGPAPPPYPPPQSTLSPTAVPFFTRFQPIPKPQPPKTDPPATPKPPPGSPSKAVPNPQSPVSKFRQQLTPTTAASTTPLLPWRANAKVMLFVSVLGLICYHLVILTLLSF